MTHRKTAILNIAVSILFAIAILVSSWLLQETEHSQTVHFLLIAAWWIPFTILSGCRKSCCHDPCVNKAN